MSPPSKVQHLGGGHRTQNFCNWEWSVCKCWQCPKTALPGALTPPCAEQVLAGTGGSLPMLSVAVIRWSPCQKGGEYKGTHTRDPSIIKVPKAGDHLEDDVRRETEMTNGFLLFLVSWLLLSLQMPALHSLILLHLSITLTAGMASFACGHLGLIHLGRPATVQCENSPGQEGIPDTSLNDWQSPCDHSPTGWYPVCFSVLPPTGTHPVCLYLLFSPSTGTEERVVKTLVWFTPLSVQTTVFSLTVFVHQRSSEAEG